MTKKLYQKTKEVKASLRKEVALACKIDTGNYSRIENGKTDPAFSSMLDAFIDKKKLKDVLSNVLQEMK